MSAAQGWIARFETIELPVVAWVIVEESCTVTNRSVGQFSEGLCMRPGWAIGPTPVGLLEGNGDDEFGKFLGYFPTETA